MNQLASLAESALHVVEEAVLEHLVGAAGAAGASGAGAFGGLVAISVAATALADLRAVGRGDADGADEVVACLGQRGAEVGVVAARGEEGRLDLVVDARRLGRRRGP